MAEGKRYSAGAIFLQVVPVFANVQRAIADESKNYERALGDSMEKAGEKAGERAGKAMAENLVDEADKAGDKAAKKYAGHFETQVKNAVKSAQKELDSINGNAFSTMTDQARGSLEGLKKQLKDLKDVDFSVNFDAKKTLAQLAELEAEVAALTKGDHEINLHANLREVQKDLGKIRSLAEAVAKDKHELRFGAKADLKQIEREVGSFERKFQSSIKGAMNALGDTVHSRAAQVRSELASLSDVEINIDMDASAAMAEAAAVEAFLTAMLSDQTLNIDVRHDLEDAVKSLKGFREQINGIPPEIVKAERSVGAFERRFKKATNSAAQSLSGSFRPELGKLADELRYLENLRIGVDISGNRARVELREIAAELEKLSKDDAAIDVRVDVLAALAELKKVETELRKIDGKTAKADVDVDAKKASRDAEQAANSFRSFNIILLAVVSAGPALIPVLAAIAGGLLAIGPAAAVAVGGLGAVLVGFSGIGDALTALGNQQDQAASNAQTSANRQAGAANQIRNAQEALADAVRNAARAEEDAAERVADARRNAARAAEDAAERVADAREQAAEAIEDALERQKDAQEEYRDAVKEVAEAEQDLRDAREQAEKDAATLARRQRQNAVDERQAVLDLGEAQNEYNNVMADGSATNTDREQAAVNLEQAQVRLNETRFEQVELAEEAADYAENGVDGSERVKSAQEQLTEALEAQKDAQEAVRESAEAADEARREGAEAVREALEDQNEILSDNARNIRQALEDQAESHSDNQRAIERAKRALSDARKQAVTDLAAIDSQAQAVNAAFDKLGPAGRDFALFLFGLRSGFYEFRDAVQQAMLPAIQEAIEGFIGSDNATKARDAMVALAEGFGKFTQALSVSFQGPAWAAFFEMMATTGPKIQEAYGGAFISLMEALASILTTTAPFALRFAEGLEKMMDAFADWAASEKGQQQILDFIAYVERVGPDVLAFFAAFAGGVVAASKALAPYGELVLGALTNILEFIENSPEAFLTALLTGATVVLFSSQLAYGVMNLMMAGAALWATAVGPWVFLIVGVGIALGVLYKTNEDFRDFIDDAWGKISKVFKKSWEKDIKPALDNLWGALMNLWDEVLRPFLSWLGPILVWVIETLLPLWLTKWAWIINGVAWLINNVLVPVMGLIGDYLSTKWKKVIKPTLEFIWKGFKIAFKAIKWVWDKILWPVIDLIGSTLVLVWRKWVKPTLARMSAGWESFSGDVSDVWNEDIKPIFEAVGDFISEHVEPKFKKAVDALVAIWDTLKWAFAQPILFVLDTVVNKGLIAGFNWVAEKVGSTPMGDVPLMGLDAIEKPKLSRDAKATGGMLTYDRRAVGGVLPGYSPGRDNYKFYSPELGELHLSGGEGILRPEVVRAAGGEQWLNGLNHAAMSGGVQAVQKKIMGFARGGTVWPVRGGYVNRTPYNLGHDGMDINHPLDATGRVPFVSATSGRVTTTGYSRGYGNAVFVASPYGELVYGHALDGSLRVSPGQSVSPGQWLANIGNTGRSSGPHLHFGFPGGTFYGAEALLTGAAIPDINPMSVGDPKGISMPKWAKSILKGPMEWMKGLISKPVEAFREKFGNNPLVDMLAKVPVKLAQKSVKFIKDLIPDPGAAWDKIVGNGVDDGDTPSAPGPESGLPGGGNSPVTAAVGGILPYNGTMKYDVGGYLPPGMTTVMNLTGKPEPVFTNDQWDEMSSGAGGQGFHYEPHFVGTDLTAADVVDDIDFARRKVQREGKYGRK